MPRTKQVLIITLALYLCTFIILLSSRITTVALVLLGFIGTYLLFQQEHRFKRIVAACITCLLLASFVYVIPVSRYRNYQEPLYLSYPSQNTHQTLSISIRASLWWLSLKSAKDVNPVWGAGPGDVKAVIKKTGEKYSISNIIESYDPHNQFLQTMLALGFLGLASLVSCFLIPAYLAFRSKDFFYLVFLGLFILTGLTESVLEMQKGIVFFTIFNSLLIFQCADWSYRGEKKLVYG